MADDQVDLLSGYGNVGVVWVGPDCTSVFRQFLLTVHMVSLGAEGVLPRGYIESLLRVFKQYTPNLPTG